MISVKEGLSSYQVNDIAIDTDGFLWAGTYKGLNRFDGIKFKNGFVFRSENPVTSYESIIKISCDRTGSIWFLTNEGAAFYSSETGQITPLNVGHEGELKDIYADNEGTVWLLANDAVIDIKRNSTPEIISFPAEIAAEKRSMTCMAGDNGNNIWIGTTNGIMLFNKQSRQFTELTTGSSQGILSNPVINSIYIDQEGVAWIGTMNGVNRYDPVDFSFSRFYPRDGGNGLSNEILDITGDDEDNLILVSADGIIFMDPQPLRYRYIYRSADTHVRAALADKNGNVWAATSRGILKIRKTDLLVRNFDTPDAERSSGEIYALFLQGNNLWAGYSKNGFEIRNTLTNAVSKKEVPSGDAVRAFYKYEGDRVLVVTDHDILVYGPEGKFLSRISAIYPDVDTGLLRNASLYCLYAGSDKTLWIGTDDGLQVLKPGPSGHSYLRVLKNEYDSTILGNIYDIVPDQDNNLWLGTDNGLVMYNPAKGITYKYTPYDQYLLNTGNKKVYRIIQQGSGVLWLGTSEGLFRFDISDHKFTALNNPELMNSSVETFTFDRFGNIWIGTDKGLFYYIMATGSYMFFDQEDGLFNYTYKASASDAGDYVYLGGEQGISSVAITSVTPVSFSHNVVITGVSWISDEGILEISYQVPDTLHLLLKKLPLRIDFAVLDFSRPENNLYKYSFTGKGIDPVVSSAGNTPYVILNSLRPGEYVLNVSGSNSGMVWNQDGDTLVIVVETPFWRSNKAILLYIFILLAITGMLFRFWTRWLFRIKRQNSEKETIARQIMEQKEELSVKNKSITDSINYAKRIQTAMLPPYKMLKSFFPSSFILYMPKDIVSGDFYWINRMNDKTFVAAVDCTGHGVPGAFMSIIGFELFRRITNTDGLMRPSDILNRLNEDFHEIFRDVDNVVLRDGMDVAFCSIDKKNRILEFAGAFNPLYLIRDNKITEIKGDRFAIGLDETNFMDQTFKNHLIPLQKDDIIYIFSDGFADQFGGPDGKKYKYRRFKHLLLNLHQLELEKQREILENNVIEWRGSQEQVDDILIIGIKVDF